MCYAAQVDRDEYGALSWYLAASGPGLRSNSLGFWGRLFSWQGQGYTFGLRALNAGRFIGSREATNFTVVRHAARRHGVCGMDDRRAMRSSSVRSVTLPSCPGLRVSTFIAARSAAQLRTACAGENDARAGLARDGRRVNPSCRDECANGAAHPFMPRRRSSAVAAGISAHATATTQCSLVRPNGGQG